MLHFMQAQCNNNYSRIPLPPAIFWTAYLILLLPNSSEYLPYLSEQTY